MERSQNPVLVLVVEDEPFVRMCTVDSLEEFGFEVIEAADADRALHVLEERDDIALVFTDVNMPGAIDGLELAQAIGDRWPYICVIVTSGAVMPGSDDLPECGCFIPKPYQPDHVASVMQRMLAS